MERSFLYGSGGHSAKRNVTMDGMQSVTHASSIHMRKLEKISKSARSDSHYVKNSLLENNFFSLDTPNGFSPAKGIEAL